MSSSRRVEGIDVARGLASLIMIQGHAYDGWVSPAGKETASYAFTRLLGSLPLPAFLVLAGAAVCLRAEAAIRRGEAASAVRVAVIRRGLRIVFYGYLANAAYALMDGYEGLRTFLRADVLHAIGISIALLAWLGLRPGSGLIVGIGRGAEAGAPPTRAAFARGAGLLVLVPSLLSVPLTLLTRDMEGPLRYLVALFSEVRGVTLMPAVPLAAWVGLGAGAAAFLLAQSRAKEAFFSAGAPTKVLFGLGAASLLLAFLGHHGTRLWVEASGAPLSRAHPAVLGNLLDLGARGLLVLSAGALLSLVLPRGLKAALIRLGQGSLVAYVFHIPFCYGALGQSVRGRLSMGSATLLVVALMAVSWLAVWGRDTLAEMRKRRREATA